MLTLNVDTYMKIYLELVVSSFESCMTLGKSWQDELHFPLIEDILDDKPSVSHCFIA